MKLFIVYLILSIAFSNGFNFSYSDNDFIEQEIRSISSQEIISDLYLFPSIKKSCILSTVKQECTGIIETRSPIVKF